MLSNKNFIIKCLTYNYKNNFYIKNNNISIFEKYVNTSFFYNYYKYLKIDGKDYKFLNLGFLQCLTDNKYKTKSIFTLSNNLNYYLKYNFIYYNNIYNIFNYFNTNNIDINTIYPNIKNNIIYIMLYIIIFNYLLKGKKIVFIDRIIKKFILFNNFNDKLDNSNLSFNNIYNISFLDKVNIYSSLYKLHKNKFHYIDDIKYFENNDMIDFNY